MGLTTKTWMAWMCTYFHAEQTERLRLIYSSAKSKDLKKIQEAPYIPKWK